VGAPGVGSGIAKPATELMKYRKQKAEERAKHLQIAREVLEDPESSPESRQWAQEFVANATGPAPA
jgi:hypothetical protein